jgi:hypothetical protein
MNVTRTGFLACSPCEPIIRGEAAMKRILIVCLIGLAVCGRPSLGAAQDVGRPSTAVVPMELDHYRITVEVTFPRPDGTSRRARAWIDTGGTDVVLAESLARDLGVDLSAMPTGGGRSIATAAPVPELRIADWALTAPGRTLSVFPGRHSRPGVDSECTLPALLFRGLRVVFDYPAKRVRLSRPGAETPVGVAVPIRVHPETGLFMVEATIAGEKTMLGVDTGSAGTWISQRLTESWTRQHPDWPRAVGAAGSTNFFGFPFETQGTLLCLPGVTLGPLACAEEIAVLGLDQKMFDWYSQKSAAPVTGFLGGEFLSHFRLEVDWASGQSWWQAAPQTRPRDLDIIPITLKAEADGSLSIAGVVTGASIPVVQSVSAGDQLLSVGEWDATRATMGRVIEALRGRPGEERRLRLRRAGQEVAVMLRVEALLARPRARLPGAERISRSRDPASRASKPAADRVGLPGIRPNGASPLPSLTIAGYS